ncbi:integrase, catalytic region, zinc finger, CCHC-type containing protein [Tanacetum coccineum]
MSNTNNNLQTQTSNALHNSIIEAGGKDRPPMLAPGIDNDIYSTVDACPNACEMWKAIERLKQGESINIQELKTVSYQKLYDIMKQHQNEVNEIRAERLARTANPLVLVAQQQPVYHPQNHPTHYTQNSSTRPQQAATRNRGKEIRAFNVAGARENVGTQVVQQYGIQCYNCKEYGHVARECQKPKRAKNTAYHKEKMLLCKQEEAGFQLNAEQVDWRDNTDDELKDQELEAHYLYMAQIQEVTLDVADNSGPIFDAELLQKHNRGEDEVDQDEDDLAKERDLLASLIEKLKCEIDENKDRNKLLESSNKNLIDKLKSEIEDFKIKNKCLESSNNLFKEANTELAKNNQLMFKDLKKFQAELDRYHNVNCASKVKIDCGKVKGELISYKMSYEKSFNEYTQKINDLNQTILEMKKELFAHQETISIMSQEKEAQKKFYKTHEDKEIEKIIALEKKVKVLDEIVYKTGQSIQTINILNRNCKMSFVKPEFLMKAQRANPRLYDIGCYNDNLALMLAPESDEIICLSQESRSKLSDLIKPFDYKNLNNLYDLFVPQREKSPEQRYFLEMSKISHTPVKNENSKVSFNKQTTLLEKQMDESIPWDQKCKSSKELFIN